MKRACSSERPLRHVFDASGKTNSWATILQSLDSSSSSYNRSQLSVVSVAFLFHEPMIPANADIVYTWVGTVRSGAYMPDMPTQPIDAEDAKADPEFA